MKRVLSIIALSGLILGCEEKSNNYNNVANTHTSEHYYDNYVQVGSDCVLKKSKKTMVAVTKGSVVTETSHEEDLGSETYKNTNCVDLAEKQ